jgi:hypothetical protein
VPSIKLLDVITDSYLLKPREQNKILLVFIQFLDITAYLLSLETTQTNLLDFYPISGSYDGSKSVLTMKTELHIITITGAASTMLG